MCTSVVYITSGLDCVNENKTTNKIKLKSRITLKDTQENATLKSLLYIFRNIFRKPRKRRAPGKIPSCSFLPEHPSFRADPCRGWRLTGTDRLQARATSTCSRKGTATQTQGTSVPGRVESRVGLIRQRVRGKRTELKKCPIHFRRRRR